MFLGSRARPVSRANNLTAICEQIVCNTMGSLKSQPPKGLHLSVAVSIFVVLCPTLKMFPRTESETTHYIDTKLRSQQET
jgi:hypothetical protein